MAPKIISGKIREGYIIPQERLPSGNFEIKIILLPKKKTTISKVDSYFGTLPNLWGKDVIKSQRKLRKEWERDILKISIHFSSMFNRKDH